MSLTYPVPNQFDASRPENQWFFYWKTSPSLWESKISQLSSETPLLVPVYWGLHANEDGAFDFGGIRPETDLYQFCQLTKKYNLRVLFLFPMTAFPFLPNGGLPPHIAYKSAVHKNGFLMSFVGENSEVYKIPSFYHPKIINEYKKFARAFGSFIQNEKIHAEIIGVECGVIGDDNLFTSLFQDYSQSFQVSFAQFLKTSGTDPFEVGNKESLGLKEKEFRKLVKELFYEVAKSNTGKHWQGKMTLSLIGGNSHQFFSRLMGQEDVQDSYINQFLASLTYNMVPCSFLLSEEMRKGILKELSGKFINSNYYHTLLNDSQYSNNEHDLTHLRFIEFLGFDSQLSNTKNIFQTWGIEDYLKKSLNWCYGIHEELFELEEELIQERVLFLNHKKITEVDSHKIFSYFFQGAKVILAQSGLDEKIRKKIDIFILENNLKVTDLNIVVPLRIVELGEGLLILIDATKLEELSLEDKDKLWRKVFELGNLKYLELETQDELNYIWSKRHPYDHELNYEEVRRVNIINTSSYKKKANIQIKDGFAFIKYIDEENVKIDQDKKMIQLEFKPRSKISLEFGYYE